jgi:glycogen operon protein
LDERRAALLNFTRRLIALRRDHPNLHRRKFFQDRKIKPGDVSGRDIAGKQVQDITWVRPDGKEMGSEEWGQGWVRCLGLRLSGRTLEDVNSVGLPITDDTFLLLFNPHWEPIKFYLPKNGKPLCWELLADTRVAEPVKPLRLSGRRYYELVPHSAALFREISGEEEPTGPVAAMRSLRA